MNPLPDGKILDSSKLKRSADDNFKFMKISGISLNGKKSLWVKEKLLVTSNFSFSYSVFKRLISQGRQNVSLCGNGIILSQPTNFRLFGTERVHRQQI